MNKEPTEKLIKTIMQHVSLLPEMQEKLLSHIFIKRIHKDHYLSLHEKDHFFLYSGILTKENQQTGDIAHFMLEGDFGIFPSDQSNSSFVSMEPCVLFAIRAGDLDNLLSQYKQLISPYRDLIFEWAKQRQKRIELLLLPAADRKAALLDRLGSSYNRIQNKDLANYLHMNVSYFSQLPL